MKSKAQTGGRLGRVLPYVTKRTPVWNLLIVKLLSSALEKPFEMMGITMTIEPRKKHTIPDVTVFSPG